MGNQSSSPNQSKTNNELKPKSVSQILDYIATYYIVTMDFKSLRKLYEKEYCDKLVILTSDIIQRYFTDLEITYLSQRIKNGVEINEEANEKVIFFNKELLAKMDIQNSIKKKRICLSIAKFYIKIAHLFAAIVTTINPVYLYKDADGNNARANLYDKGKIPANTPRQIYKLNICDNRINALKNNQSLEPDANGEIYVNPKVCDMNLGSSGEEKSLNNEPGIPELMELYLDDKYDFDTGTFTGMTEKTKKVFNEDLKIFYNVFTGNKEMPSTITKFSDIKLREYNKFDQCQGKDPIFKRKYKGSITNKLFKDYADNLNKMIQTANKNQEALLSIINQLFVYTIDPQTNKKQIRVNPALTEQKLQEIVVETRALIIKLYLTCEMDYVNGLKMYEAIVEQKILETAQSQIKTLENMSENLIVADAVTEQGSVTELKQMEAENISKEKAKLEEKLNNLEINEKSQI